MGTQSAPNLVITLIDISDGLPETGLAVVVVPYGGTLTVDDITLTEIGVTGKYAKSTANGMDAVTQGVYEVYADSGGGYEFRGTYIHGGDALEAHRISSSDPHSVTAQQVSVTDVGSHFAGNEVETILQEVGDALDSIPSVDAAVLLDSSTQTVSSVKPKITNLNADKVDGHHATNAANGLLILDSDGKVPASVLPEAGEPFAGDADTLDGKHQGQGSGKIPKWNSVASHNDLDTSLAGKKASGANNNLVLMSSAAGTPVTDKLHTSFLHKKYPLVAQANNLILQAGWGYKSGAGAQGFFDVGKSFSESFRYVPIAVLVTPAGNRLTSSGVPTSLDDFDDAEQMLSADVFEVSESSFSMHLYTDTGNNLPATHYFGYSYIAIGTKA